METGEVMTLNASSRADIEKVVGVARDICGYEFAVYGVLLAIDPKRRTMDIVTGSRVRRTLDDRACEFALLSLRSSLQADQLVAGIRDSVMMLAEHARAPRTLHLDEPA
jgi:hypothetical protein